jgi:hypothetical protein
MFACGSLYAGQIENPMYTQWAKFKPGTSVTLATESNTAGQTSKMETKTTLKDLTDDKLTLETAMSMDAGGQKMDMPAQTMEVKKMIDDPAAAAGAAGQAQANMPKPDTKTSDESVTVAAGTFKTKLTEATMDVGGNKTVSKTWTSDEVPGGVVKMEATSDGQMKSTTKMELKAFDKK